MNYLAHNPQQGIWRNYGCINCEPADSSVPNNTSNKTNSIQQYKQCFLSKIYGKCMMGPFLLLGERGCNPGVEGRRGRFLRLRLLPKLGVLGPRQEAQHPADEREMAGLSPHERRGRRAGCKFTFLSCKIDVMFYYLNF